MKKILLLKKKLAILKWKIKLKKTQINQKWKVPLWINLLRLIINNYNNQAIFKENYNNLIKLYKEKE